MYKHPVTVLMPVYNAGEKEFRIAIESILNQTFSDFEFLIINDGSTNNTEDIVKSYNDSRIRYEKNAQNSGIIYTLNKGLELIQSKYIARLDSDDYSYPTRLEKQYHYMEENPNIGALGTLIEGKNNTPTNPKDVTLLQRYVYGCIVHSSAMIRKSVLDENNLKYNRNCKHAEDFKLWGDISRYSDLAIYPEILTMYRRSENGISQNNLAYQNKMVGLIMLDNMIQDFPCNKKYLYGILDKFMSTTPVTKEEYTIFKSFLNNVVNAIQPQVSEQYKEEVKIFILAELSYFIKNY